MTTSRARALLFLIAVLAPLASAAERAAEIVRLHLEAIGGRERLEAMSSFRAQGQLVAGNTRAELTLLAARPNLVQLELRYSDRTTIQSTDGNDPPWTLDTAERGGKSTLMGAAVAKAFLADAEFDDPFLIAEAKGHQVEFRGEATVKGQRFLRLLVTKRPDETFFLLLDPKTYFIAMRVEPHAASNGRHMGALTRYSDFRPVRGVLVAHRIAVELNGQLVQEARIDHIEPNPVLPPGIFSRPPSAALENP